ncbi:MAG: SMP-30/gluconolactonase/LRE family protein [Candidatus Nealsonbacteria bacterium]
MKPQLITSIKARLGEGPFWFEDALYWIDILSKKIYRYFPKEEKTEEMQLDQYIGALSPRKKGGFVLALKNGFYFLDKFKGSPTPIINPEADKPNNRFNDGKCDAKGRFWAGTMSLSNSSDQGSLYMLDENCQVYKKYSPVTISNGICWSSDNKSMYYIDTPTHQILRFDFNLATGEIKNAKPIITIDPKIGSPDGMTIDSNDCLWIALWGGSAVVCYDPKTAKLLHKIDLPVSQVTSCSFGGPDLDELYITTATEGLFKIKPGVKGFPTNSFAG